MVFQETFGKYINGYNMNRRYTLFNGPGWRHETGILTSVKTSGTIIVLTYLK